MEICTIGFTQTSAQRFFEALKHERIERLVDVRLHNVSQLAGFAKREDLRYFLRQLVGAEYVHEPLLAPTEEMLAAYRHNGMDWAEYERRFRGLLAERRVHEQLDPALFERPTVLLCSERTAERCHRRIVVEHLSDHWPNVTARHL